MDFAKLSEFIPYFLPAAWMTLKITTLGILIGLFIGFPMAFGRLSTRKWLSLPSKGYIALIRGTPLLLQLFVVYYGLVRLVALDPLPSAALALGVHNGAYIAEIIRGAIQSIHKGQSEAALSLGMTPMQAMRRIIIPQALLRALPPLGNQTPNSVSWKHVILFWIIFPNSPLIWPILQHAPSITIGSMRNNARLKKPGYSAS